MIYSFDIIPSHDNTVSAQVETILRIINTKDKDLITTSLKNIEMTYSGDILNLTLPDKLFSQKVPFSIVTRKITISVPDPDHITLHNNTTIE